MHSHPQPPLANVRYGEANKCSTFQSLKLAVEKITSDEPG